MILGPGPIFIHVHANPVRVLVRVGMLMVQQVTATVNVGADTDWKSAKHVREKIIPGPVGGKSVVNPLVDQAEKGVLPTCHDQSK